MSLPNQNTTNNAAAEPDGNNTDLRARQQLANSGIVEVRRSRFLSLVSRLTRSKRRPEADDGSEQHFHADRVEDVSSIFIGSYALFIDICVETHMI